LQDYKGEQERAERPKASADWFHTASYTVVRGLGPHVSNYEPGEQIRPRLGPEPAALLRLCVFAVNRLFDGLL
jgi:hypothetical protein